VFYWGFVEGKLCFWFEMASSETPSLSLRHGVRIQLDLGIPVEVVLLAVGECVGHGNLSHTSRMNRGLLVFFKRGAISVRFIIALRHAEWRLPAGVPARGAHHPGHRVRGSPVTPRLRVGVACSASGS